MVMGCRDTLILDINGVSVLRSSSHRFLGFTLDSNLHFSSLRKEHRQCVSSMVQVVRILHARHRGLSSRAAVMLITAITHGKLLYTLPFVSLTSSTIYNSYLALQARLCRPALGLIRTTSSLLSIAEAGQPPLYILALRRLRRYFTRLSYTFPQHPLLSLLASNNGRLGTLFRETATCFNLPPTPPLLHCMLRLPGTSRLHHLFPSLI